MPAFFRRLALFVAAFIAFAHPMPALAWWDYGHETVADIALANVKPATKLAVQRLLARQKLLETPSCPVRTIAQASLWADCVKQRPLRDRFSYMESWHYQNVELCKPFDLKAACRDGHCVSAQIERQLRLLKDRSVPERERLMALALLVHFVGDLHQPLHAVDHNDDGGGNGSRTDYGIVQYRRLSLHRVWDGYLPERAISSAPALVRPYPAAERATLAAGSVEEWSKEGWELARAQVYPTAFSPDYCQTPKDKRGAISQASIEALVPVVRDQVMKGGLRLARLLDEALG
jgi:hypothetical protein